MITKNGIILYTKYKYYNIFPFLVYFRPLEEDLRSDTSGTFKRMMTSLCTANRDESMATNIQWAQTDAQALLTAGDLQLGTDESTFNAILCQRNFAQLQLIFEEYAKIAGNIFQITKFIYSASVKKILLFLISGSRSRH